MYNKRFRMIARRLGSIQSSSKNRTDEKMVALQGSHSPYSNFDRPPFLLDGLKFDTSEQYIQYQKAILLKDSHTTQAILSATTPSEAKKIGYQVQNFDMRMWKGEGYKTCCRGMKAKFKKNPDLLGMLVSNKPKLLVEVSIDKLWGTGVSLRDINALNQS